MLLGDRDWWVRFAAKQTLEAMGVGCVAAAGPLFEPRGSVRQKWRGRGVPEPGSSRQPDSDGGGERRSRRLTKSTCFAASPRLEAFASPTRSSSAPGRPSVRASEGCSRRLDFRTWERPDVQPLLQYSAVVALAGLLTVAMVTVALALKYGGRQEDSADDHDALAASRFTIPVSVIVPLDEPQSPRVSRDDRGAARPQLSRIRSDPRRRRLGGPDARRHQGRLGTVGARVLLPAVALHVDCAANLPELARSAVDARGENGGRPGRRLELRRESGPLSLCGASSTPASCSNPMRCCERCPRR